MVAQTDPAAQFKTKVFPPSPEAANLGRYGDNPVSLNNGLVNISIPIYELKGKKLSFPISLSYHAGGVKAYDIASAVGLGWTLNATGAIGRTVLGSPDESGIGVLNKLIPTPSGPGEHFSCFIGNLANTTIPYDGQADLFNYNLGGSSGKFVFKNIKAIGTPFEIATIPYSPIKINVNATFQSFTIIDLDGTIYLFDKVETTTVSGQYTSAPTTWYLTSTVSSDKSDTIKFTYTQPIIVNTATGSNSLSERQDAAVSAASRTTSSRSGSFSTHLSVSIQSIVSSNGKVTFDYATDRQDADGNRLTTIHVFQRKLGLYTEIKRFNFNQSYFTASLGQSSQVAGFVVNASQLDKRLRLDSFYEEGFVNGVSEALPPHSFEYEAGQFPVYGSTAQDFMGFYNGAHSNKNLLFYDLGPDAVSLQYGANRSVNPSYVKAGSLKKIIYPTGGYSLFELEPNQVMDGVTLVYTGGLRIKSITNNDGQGTAMKKKYVYTKWYYNSNLFNGNMTQMAGMFVALNQRWFPTGVNTYGKYYYKNYGENLTFQAASSSGMVAAYEEVEEYEVDALDNSVGKTVTTYNKAVDNIPSLAPNFRSDEEWKRSQVANRKIYRVNGTGQFVLIKEEINIYDYALIGAVKNYTATLNDEATSPGAGITSFKECNTISSFNSYNWMDFDQNIYKSNLISSTIIDYDDNGLNPKSTLNEFVYGNSKHLQLSKSTIEKSDGKKEVSNIKYPLDYTIGSCDLTPCYSTYNIQINDLTIQKTTCETTYYNQYLNYSTQASQIFAPIWQTKQDCDETCRINGGFSGCYNNCNNNYQSALTASLYDETIALANTAFSNYLACSTTFQTSVNQTVLPQLNTCVTNYNSCVSAILSGGTLGKDKSILIMQRDNVINRVIENSSGFLVNTTEYVTSAAKTDFKVWANNTTGPDVVWKFTSSSPVAKTTFDLNSTPYYTKAGSFIRYDNANNILERAKDSDISTSYLWDYNKVYPIAEVINASVDDIAHTSFEADGTGNFTSIIGTARNTVDYITGKRSYSMASGAISKTGLTSAKKYTISFWAKSGAAISINGGATLSPYSSTSVNGWQYFETSLTSISSITLSGTGIMDELRIFPTGALVTTYTYDPMIGITSVNDPSNNIAYYTYDNLGRLKWTQDYKRNILKSVTYHYKGQ